MQQISFVINEIHLSAFFNSFKSTFVPLYPWCAKFSRKNKNILNFQINTHSPLYANIHSKLFAKKHY